MDIIKEIVCTDVYHIIVKYLKQVVIFDVKKVFDPYIRQWGNPKLNNIFKIVCDIDLLIYLCDINSSCLHIENSKIIYTHPWLPPTIIKTIIYNNIKYTITEGSIRRVVHQHYWCEPHGGTFYLKKEGFIVNVVDPEKNYAIDFKDNNSLILHSDIIDYYCNIDYNNQDQVDNESMISNGQIDMYFCLDNKL